ncbi:MAG: hypothetical protein HY475_02630 [Candidatus Terrybacteria bacterium]|nr:hypothetical protein [Candidatus Terrybacteria bacterium]
MFEREDRLSMIAIALLFVLLATPIVLWILGFEAPAIVAGIFVAASAPSIVQVFQLAVFHREWPRISGGPSIVWAGQRIGFGPRTMH